MGRKAGTRQSEAAKEKLRQIQTGRKLSDETRAKMSQSAKARRGTTGPTRAEIRARKRLEKQKAREEKAARAERERAEKEKIRAEKKANRPPTRRRYPEREREGRERRAALVAALLARRANRADPA
jgi:hypothetical protein